MSKNDTKYIDRFNKENYDNVSIRIRKGKKQVWRDFADKHGMSLAELIIKAVEKYMEG